MKTPSVLAAAIACGVAALLAAQTPAGSARQVQFSVHEIGTGLRGGYQVIVADLNKDGKPDIVALASGMPELVWYQNPGWERHVIGADMRGMVNVSAYHIDGDGIPELALAQGFNTNAKTSTGIVSILTHSADVTAPWTAKEIDRVPTAHRLRWIDADGSGKKWLVNAPLIGPDSVAPDYKSPVSIAFYRPPDFKREIVTDSFSGLIHGLEPVSWPGVRGQAFLSAGFMGIHLHRFADGKWATTNLTGATRPTGRKAARATRRSAGSVRSASSERFEPWHGNEVVIYKESGTTWSRQAIDDGITDGHTIVAVDIDNDGRDEFVVGQRGGVKSLMLYQASKDGASWSKRAIDEGGMAGAGCAAADFNSDKQVDLVCIGTSTANVKVYENLGAK